MPVARCPQCGFGQLFEGRLLGQPISCIRCELWIRAEVLSRSNRLRDFVFVAAVATIGVAVSWLILRGPSIPFMQFC